MLIRSYAKKISPTFAAVLIFAGLFVGTIGCGNAGFENSVRDRASFDFGCPAANIQVVDTGAGGIGAIGCDKRATYVWVRGTGLVLNSDIQSTASTTTTTAATASSKTKKKSAPNQ